MKNIPLIGQISALGLGTWKLAGKECESTIKMALELGYRHIDTADYYHNHEAIGNAIKGFPREELFIVTKIIGNELHPKMVSGTCERLLKELQTPYIDLLLIHWPSSEIPAANTLIEMLKLKEKKWIKQIGVSNFMISDLKQIENHHFPIMTNQIECHPYLQEELLTNYCQQHEMIVTAYRPIQRAAVMHEPLLIKIGEKYNKTPIQVTLRWLYQRNIVSIPKATSRAHLIENYQIFDFSLSTEEMKAIKSLNSNTRYVM